MTNKHHVAITRWRRIHLASVKKLERVDANYPWGSLHPPNPVFWFVQIGTDPVGSGLVAYNVSYWIFSSLLHQNPAWSYCCIWYRKLESRLLVTILLLFHVFSCDQEALWMIQSLPLSVCPTACHALLIMFPSWYHHVILGVMTIDKSYVHSKVQGKRSKVKVPEVKTQFSHLQRVWIHIWWWNDAQSLMRHRRGVLLFFNVIPQLSRSHRTIHCQFWLKMRVSD